MRAEDRTGDKDMGYIHQAPNQSEAKKQKQTKRSGKVRDESSRSIVLFRSVLS